jgi:hypothetical protein
MYNVKILIVEMEIVRSFRWLTGTVYAKKNLLNAMTIKLDEKIKNEHEEY